MELFAVIELMLLIRFWKTRQRSIRPAIFGASCGLFGLGVIFNVAAYIPGQGLGAFGWTIFGAIAYLLVAIGVVASYYKVRIASNNNISPATQPTHVMPLEFQTVDLPHPNLLHLQFTKVSITMACIAVVMFICNYLLMAAGVMGVLNLTVPIAYLSVIIAVITAIASITV